MKRKTGWYAVLMACMVTLQLGCSDQECLEVESGRLNQVVLTGSAETKVLSRSALSDEGVFSWLKGDKIDVYASDNAMHEFVLTEGAGTNQGDFSAELVEGTTVGNYAFSPSGMKPTFQANGIWSVTLPAAYTWEANQTHAPMISNIKDGVLSFKNLGGIVKFYLRNIDSGCRIEVTSSTHQLAGTMDLQKDADKNQTLQMVKGTSNNTITFTSTSNEEKQAFYLPLPVTAEDDKVKLNVKVYDAADNGVLRMEKNTTLAICRNQLILMPSLTFPEAEEADVKQVASAENLNEVLGQIANDNQTNASKDISITINSNSNLAVNEEAKATVEVSDPITIPAALTAPSQGSSGEGEGEGEDTPGEGEGEEETAAPTVKIVFDEVPTATTADKKIVLTDNQEVTEGESKSQSEVEVAIPEAPEGVEAPSFEISLPTTTVTLTATQETATFNEVWATTADNTLKVAKGVTINNLYVISGNVEVTGRIENITNTQKDKTVYVRVHGAGSVGTVTGKVSIIIDGQDINTPFDNESGADGQNVPYEIANLEQLRSLANRVEAGYVNDANRPYADCYYILTSDIDLDKDMLWKPIGTASRSFNGIFDGDGHVISGNLNLGKCDNGGFFGRIKGGSVKNLQLSTHVQVISPDSIVSYSAGGLVGNMYEGTLENCHFKGTVSIHTKFIGGLVGTAKSSNFRMCSNTGNLTNLNTFGLIGGLIGFDAYSTLIGCYNTGNLTVDYSSGYCGGIMAESLGKTTIKACWVKGTFVAETTGALCTNFAELYVSNCYWAESLGNMSSYSSGLNGSNGTFTGTVPTTEQILDMNAVISSLGWYYKEDGTLAPMESNHLPSNPIQPW